MRKSFIFLTLLVVALVIAGCNTQTTQQPATPTEAIIEETTAAPEATNAGEAMMEKVEIKMTDTGFEPKSTTVKTGTVVTFINTGQEDHQVASAPHPQHTDLPGFDALKGVKPGESYEFKFEKLGTWKFHDHLNPTLFGSITVE
ncbi:cupredoxin domain-containing protein [Candidatus Microgenomates bacterium]|nr:cupredoxin domain-containing protein [Candidatus Microgenomates bacterium]